MEAVSAWLKRFGLHMAAAIGATSIFVAAAAVGASQTQTPPAPMVVPASPSQVQSPAPPPNQPRERSLAGTIVDVLPDGLHVLGVGGRDWRVWPAPGALIRLNGKTTRLDALHTGDTLVILGQTQPKDGPRLGFFAHAITARRK